jgi:hypothetical protein
MRGKLTAEEWVKRHKSAAELRGAEGMNGLSSWDS